MTFVLQTNKIISLSVRRSQSSGVVAQLVEHLLCKQGVVSSSLISSTRINKAVHFLDGFLFFKRLLLGQPSPSRQFEPDRATRINKAVHFLDGFFIESHPPPQKSVDIKNSLSIITNISIIRYKHGSFYTIWCTR